VRTSRLFLVSSVVLVVSAILAACDKSPTVPTPPPGGSNPPGQPALLTLEVVGPDTVALGGTAQFAAMERYSDGSSRDISSRVTWRSSSPAVLSVSATGLATAHESGEVSISATPGRDHFAFTGEIIVVPAGTYRLSGSLYDDKFPLFSDAQVTILAGSGAGFTTTARGFFRLYGVVGNTEIRITAPGYDEYRQRLDVRSHQSVRIGLALSNPRQQVAGTYKLRIRAADECRSTLSDEAMDRTYTAVVDQDGPLLTAALSGATFVTTGGRTMNTFGGRVELDQVSFFLSTEFSETFPFPMVAEQLTTSSYVAVSGTVATTSSGSRRTGLLDGTIMMLEGPSPYRRIAACSGGHRFELSK